jgi:hypothetical protein
MLNTPGIVVVEQGPETSAVIHLRKMCELMKDDIILKCRLK